MKALRRLRMKADAFAFIGPRNSKMFYRASRQARQFLPPVVGRKIYIGRPHQVPNFTAFVCLFDSRPGVIKLLLETIRFVGENHSVRQKIEYGAVRAGDRSVELPSRKHADSPSAHGLLDDLFRAGDALSRQADMNRSQQIVTDRSLSKRKQQCLVDRSRGPLRSRIEL